MLRARPGARAPVVATSGGSSARHGRRRGHASPDCDTPGRRPGGAGSCAGRRPWRARRRSYGERVRTPAHGWAVGVGGSGGCVVSRAREGEHGESPEAVAGGSRHRAGRPARAGPAKRGEGRLRRGSTPTAVPGAQLIGRAHASAAGAESARSAWRLNRFTGGRPMERSGGRSRRAWAGLGDRRGGRSQRLRARGRPGRSQRLRARGRHGRSPTRMAAVASAGDGAGATRGLDRAGPRAALTPRTGQFSDRRRQAAMPGGRALGRIGRGWVRGGPRHRIGRERD
jgi:hypothetical protein